MKTNRRSSLFTKAFTLSALLLVAALPLQAQKKEVKPLRALLITAGCCHSYATQKDILKNGIEARANIIVDQIHTDDSTTNPPAAFYGNPDYAKGYDVIIHDECAAAMADVAILKGILAPHQNGIPGVNLHCAMHSYRVGDHKVPAKAGTDASLWFDYLGIQSSAHGPKEPIIIDFSKVKNPITKGFETWATGPEELYNNVQIFPSATGLATGTQHQPERKQKDTVIPAQDAQSVVIWTNTYHDARVFSTTIGHYDVTVADDRYLDLVTRGVLWSCKKLNKNYLK